MGAFITDGLSDRSTDKHLSQMVAVTHPLDFTKMKCPRRTTLASYAHLAQSGVLCLNPPLGHMAEIATG